MANRKVSLAAIRPMDDVEKLRDALYFAAMLMLNDDKKARSLARGLYENAGKLLHAPEGRTKLVDNVVSIERR